MSGQLRDVPKIIEDTAQIFAMSSRLITPKGFYPQATYCARRVCPEAAPTLTDDVALHWTL